MFTTNVINTASSIINGGYNIITTSNQFSADFAAHAVKKYGATVLGVDLAINGGLLATSVYAAKQAYDYRWSTKKCSMWSALMVGTTCLSLFNIYSTLTDTYTSMPNKTSA